MLTIRRNFGLLLFYFTRCVSNSSFSGHKHYQFFVRHVKTNLNNHSYIIKKTTAIPKIINYRSPVSYREIPSTIGTNISCNQLLPSTKHSKFKITSETANTFLEKSVRTQDVINKLVTHYSTKEHIFNSSNNNLDKVEKVKKSCFNSGTPSCHAKTNESRDDKFSNNNAKENISSNYRETYLIPTQQKKTSFQDDKITDYSNSFSLIKLKGLVSNKIKDILMTNFTKNDIFSDDLIILNQKIPEKESLIFFKNKDLYVIESLHTNFKNEIRNYIKKLDTTEENMSAAERLNFITFSKVNSSCNLFDEPMSYKSIYSKDHLLNLLDSHHKKNYSSDHNSTVDSGNGLYETTLKTKNSVPLEKNTEKFWIPYEEKDNLQGFYELSPQSGPPFTEQVPINRDKLIEEKVVPNTSILNIINSIDKSAVIIQKDLYITDRIIQKIQKEEKHEEADKNRQETTGKKDDVMYLDTPSGKRAQEVSNKKDVDVSQTKSNEFSNHNNKHSDLPAFVTLNSIDNDGKISLSMLYEPNKIVPMFSFLSKEAAQEYVKSNNRTGVLNSINLINKLSGQLGINQSQNQKSKDKLKNTNEMEKIILSNKISADDTQSHSSKCSNNNYVNPVTITKGNLPEEGMPLNYQDNPNHSIDIKLQDNYQLSTATKNRLKQLEEFSHHKITTKEYKKNNSQAFKEVERFAEPDGRSQEESLKDYTPHKKIYVYDSRTTSLGEGIPMDVYINRCNNTTSQESINRQNSDIKNSPMGDNKSKFLSPAKESLEMAEIDNPNKEMQLFDMTSPTKENPTYVTYPDNSTPSSLHSSYKMQPISNDQTNNLENGFSKLKKLINDSEEKKSSETLSGVDKSLETLMKFYILKNEMSVSHELKNESEKQYSGTPKEETSHIARNIIPDIVKSVEILLQKYISKKEISVPGVLSNEFEKKCSEIPREEPNCIAHHIVQAVTGSLESWLKDNIPKKIISFSDSPKNVSRKQYSDMTIENPSHLTLNIVPGIVKSLETLLKDYFSKTKNSVSKASFPDEEIPIEHHIYDLNNTKTLLEDNDYKPSNMTNSELEVIEKDFLNQEEIIDGYEKKYSDEIYKDEPTHNVELLAEEKPLVSEKNYPLEEDEYFLDTNNTETKSKDNILINIKDKQLFEDNMHKTNKKSKCTLTDLVNCPQFFSLGCSNEAGSKMMINKENNMEHSRSITKEGSCNEKRIFFYNSSTDSDVQVPLKNNTYSNLSALSNKESSLPPIMKYGGDVLRGLSSNSGHSEKGPSSGRKSDEKSNKTVPIKKKFENSKTNNSSVDRVKKTTISSVEQNNFTDINVSEVETYVDSRLPIPFSTETFFQIFGSNHFLRDHSSLIDVAKYRLSTPNKIMEQYSNLSVMAKLDDIRRSVQYLNILAMNSKSLQSKENITKNKDFFLPKEVSESSAINKGIVKGSIKQQYSKSETPKNKKEGTIIAESVSNSVSKVSFKIFNNNDQKQINKKNLLNQNNTSEIKNQDHKTPSKDENGLLIVETKNENIKEAEMNIKKTGIQKTELTGVKISKGKYVDLRKFNKNEKNKINMLKGQKKGLYDHRRLSKRDKKILREITKEIPKQKFKGKSSRRRPIKPIISRKTENEIKQPKKSLVNKSKDTASKVTLAKKNSELVDKTVVPSTHSLNKKILLPPGKHSQEKKEVHKTIAVKKENTSNKIIQRVDKKSAEKEKSLINENKKLKEINLDKIVEKIKISEEKSSKGGRFNTSEKVYLKQVTKSEKHPINNIESKNISNDGDNLDKSGKTPTCQTYVATEAYISQQENTHMIPEKMFTSKKIIQKNPTPQKVTILENIKPFKENKSDILKIQEDFKEELIRKSQNKIEHRTNIDYRVRTPKLRSPKSKVVTFKSKQKGKLTQATVPEKMHALKKDKKITETKNRHVSKTRLKNKTDLASPKEIKTAKKTSATRKSTSQQKNIKDEENVNQLVQHKKESFPQTKPKTTELISNKTPDRVSKVTEKPQYNEQLKMAAPDKLKSPKEPKIDKNTVATVPSENIDKKNFPMFLIDVDKMSKEIKPELDLINCQKCQVAHDKLVDFPLHNQQKKLLFKPPFKILKLGPSNDPMLRNELRFFPSVTKVLNSTIPENSREILREWRRGMIAELGENGFKLFYRGQLVDGNKFNRQLHNFLISREKYKQDFNNLGLKSIENVLRRTSDLSAVNSHVIHRKLAYRGVVDCVAKYQNKPVLIEWKRIENPQMKIENSSIDIAATQLSAYVGALNYDETYKFQISGGLIVLAYNDGSEAEVIEINTEQCNKHWKKWLRRLQTYHELSRNKTM